jgi:hypothetical protein
LNQHDTLFGWFGFMVFNATFTIFQLYRGGQFYWWSARRIQPTGGKQLLTGRGKVGELGREKKFSLL